MLGTVLYPAMRALALLIIWPSRCPHPKSIGSKLALMSVMIAIRFKESKIISYSKQRLDRIWMITLTKNTQLHQVKKSTWPWRSKSKNKTTWTSTSKNRTQPVRKKWTTPRETATGLSCNLQISIVRPRGKMLKTYSTIWKGQWPPCKRRKVPGKECTFRHKNRSRCRWWRRLFQRNWTLEFIEALSTCSAAQLKVYTRLRSRSIRLCKSTKSSLRPTWKNLNSATLASLKN